MNRREPAAGIVVAPVVTPLTIITSVPVAQWVRGDLGVHLTTGVDTWADQSGNARDFTQPTGGAQPTYNATDATLNNRPTLTCDGVGMFMDSTWARPAPGTTPTFVWAIIKQNGWTSTRQLIADKTVNRFLMVQQAVNPNLLERCNGTGNASNALAVGTWGRAEMYHSNTVADYIKLIGTTASGTVVGAGGVGTGTRFGCDAGGTLFASFSIAELLVTAGLPNAGEITGLNSYANGLYGAGIAL